MPWDTKNPANNPKLRDDISTDEITPAHYCFYFDETLGEIPYAGLKCGDVMPIGRGDVKNGGFVCSVSGKRRGKGSSREQSPYAEMCAGIQVAIAENIERIYKQNCQNLGLLTSTNFSLIDRIRAGEEIALSEFTAGEDEITRQVIEYGGLFPFNVARMQGKVFLPPIESTRRGRPRYTGYDSGGEDFRRHMITQTARSAFRGQTWRHRIYPRRSALQPRVRHADGVRFSTSNMLARMFRSTIASSIRFFRDHLTFLDEVISEEKKKMGLLDLATQLKLKQEDFAQAAGDQAARRT